MITNTANRNTVTTTVVCPMPTTAISTGTSAETGALTNTLTQTRRIRPTVSARAIRMPTGTPTAIAHAMPSAKARSEIHAAAANLPDVTTATPLAATRLSGGTMDATPARPTASHRKHQTASEATVRSVDRPASVSGASPHMLLQLLPDLVDRVQVALVAADLVRAP